MTPCVALLRGVNVGRAKRIAMADLRALVEALGFADVRTLLNSGNVVFKATRPDVGKIAAAAIATAIETGFGFTVSVVMLTATTLDAIVAGNTLHQATDQPSRFLVAFAADRASRARAGHLLDQTWAPEAIALGNEAVYLWCADGILESKLAAAFSRATGDVATARNWATVLKLQAAAAALR